MCFLCRGGKKDFALKLKKMERYGKQAMIGAPKPKESDIVLVDFFWVFHQGFV